MESTRFRKSTRSLAVAAMTLAGLMLAGATTSQAAPGECMADAKNDPSLNCTANDFGISSITLSNIVDGCATFGDTFTFDALFGIGGSTVSRYDIGFYVSTDGKQAYTGTCDVTVRGTTGDPSSPPYPLNLDNDQCGDYDGSAFLHAVSNVTSKCEDSDRDGFYDIVICTSWDNNSEVNCSGPGQAIPSTKSKCNCQVINTDIVTPHCASNADCSSDDNICTDEVCNSRESKLGDDFGCSHDPNTVTCNDGLFCTLNDHCAAGECVGNTNTCSDDNVCTTDTCNEGSDTCEHVDNTVTCNDGLFCTTGDVCANGECHGSARNCGDGNVCTDDSCNENADTCDHVDNVAPCDNGLFCDGSDTCSGGSCRHSGNPCDGSDGDADCSETCDETADNCNGNDPNGTGCDDGLFCTSGDTCTNGTCSGPATDCNDDNVCTTDSCDEGGNQCLHSNNTNPCDDGLFCTVNDVCSGGSCSGAANACSDDNDCTTDTCDDQTDTCGHQNNTDPCNDGLFCTEGDTCDGQGSCVGTTKTCNDENVCTDDSCDEAGDACVNAANTVSCDDGIYCNGTDTCAAKSCGHSGNPCPGADGDGNCAETCNEDAENCSASDPNGSVCDDGLYCNGGPDHCQDGLCSQHPGRNCDDGKFCTNDSCDEDQDKCVATNKPNGTVCDDEEICTIEDACQAGNCVGQDTVLADLCPWITVEKQDPKRDLLKINSRAYVGGDTCGGLTKIGNQTEIDGDVVSNAVAGTRAIRITPDAILDEDIVSFGAGVKARPRVAKLPHLATPVSALAPGSLTMKLEPPGGVYDLTGAHPLAKLCDDARNQYPQVMAVLDALPSAGSEGKLKIGPGQTKTYTASPPGSVSVFDITQYRTGHDTTLEFNGGGDPDSVIVLRIAKKFMMKLRSEVVLTGSMQPQNVLIYAKGKKCVVGDLMTGAGTIFCGNGRLKTGRTLTWSGTFYGAGKVLKIGDTNVLEYIPFTGF